MLNFNKELFKNRIVPVNGLINDKLATNVCTQILYLNSIDSSKPIALYINSLGGNALAGLLIYDTIRSTNSKIITVCLSQAASIASLVLAAGDKGKRYAMKHSLILMHQLSGGYFGQTSELKRHTRSVLKIEKQIIKLYMKHCHKSFIEVKRKLNRDCLMSATQALT